MCAERWKSVSLICFDRKARCAFSSGARGARRVTSLTHNTPLHVLPTYKQRLAKSRIRVNYAFEFTSTF